METYGGNQRSPSPIYLHARDGRERQSSASRPTTRLSGAGDGESAGAAFRGVVQVNMNGVTVDDLALE